MAILAAITLLVVLLLTITLWGVVDRTVNFLLVMALGVATVWVVMSMIDAGVARNEAEIWATVWIFGGLTVPCSFMGDALRKKLTKLT